MKNAPPADRAVRGREIAIEIAIEVAIEVAARRDGGPTRLAENSTPARSELGWTSRFAALDTVVGHAWGCENRGGRR